MRLAHSLPQFAGEITGVVTNSHREQREHVPTLQCCTKQHQNSELSTEDRIDVSACRSRKHILQNPLEVFMAESSKSRADMIKITQVTR